MASGVDRDEPSNLELFAPVGVTDRPIHQQSVDPWFRPADVGGQRRPLARRVGPVPAADKLVRDHVRRAVHFLVRLDKRLDMVEDLPVAAFERFEKGTGRPPEVAPRLA